MAALYRCEYDDAIEDPTDGRQVRIVMPLVDRP